MQYVGWKISPANPESGQPVDFGKRSRDYGIATVDQVKQRLTILWLDKLRVSLVDQQNHVFRQAVAQPAYFTIGDHRAAGVARIDHKYHACVRHDRIQQGIHVHGKLRFRGNVDSSADHAGQRTHEQVTVTAHQDSILRRQVTLHQDRHQFHRTRATEHAIGIEVVHPGYRRPQFAAIGVGIEVSIANRGFDRVAYPLRWRATVLVLRKHNGGHAFRSRNIRQLIGIHGSDIGVGFDHRKPPNQLTQRRALRNMRIHGPYSPHSGARQEFCMLRKMRSGCGIMMVKRPSSLQNPLSPSAEPFGFSG